MEHSDNIFVKGARANNLKNIDVEIPRGKFVVITGSTNLKRDGNANKANASVAILEDKTDHAIFDTYKAFIDGIVDARK